MVFYGFLWIYGKMRGLPELATTRLAAVLLGEFLECTLLGDIARLP